MCIIVAKEKGVKLPSKSVLQECFKNNNDGAGLMYVQDNKVVIDKGYMNFKDFYKRIKKLQKRFNSNLTDKAIVMHFRIGTSGENDKKTTHPFPISNNAEDLRKTYIKTDLGMAHNGIISNYVYGEDLSDTQNFVKDFVSVFKSLNKKFFLNESVMKLIEKEANSKLCFLDSNENIYYLGDFKEENGVKYSNNSYKENIYSYYYDTNTWKEYKPKKEKTAPKTIQLDKLVNERDYEVLETGDYYEFLDGTGDYVLDGENIVVDSDYNVYIYQKDLNDNGYLSLIGENAIIYDKHFILKMFYWEDYDYNYGYGYDL